MKEPHISLKLLCFFLIPTTIAETQGFGPVSEKVFRMSDENKLATGDPEIIDENRLRSSPLHRD